MHTAGGAGAPGLGEYGAEARLIQCLTTWERTVIRPASESAMASNTKKTSNKRLRRTRAAGKARKKQLNLSGTTRTEAELFGNELVTRHDG
jgi:hypothetical protein